MVEHEETFHHRIALRRLHQLKQRVFVERTIYRCDNGERLSAIQQVGITDGRLLVHAEHLGLLQHLTEVAQLRIAFQLLPKGKVAPFCTVGSIIVVGPFGAGTEECSCRNAQHALHEAPPHIRKSI